MWEKPIPGVTRRETEESPWRSHARRRARASQVLWDSVRPFKTVCGADPPRAFIDCPGRPHGSTLLEKMVPLQKRYNRVEAHIAQHTNLCTDPILLVHEAAEIDDDEWVARPGLRITHGYNGPGDPAKFLSPPPLSPTCGVTRRISASRCS
jgi:hypothetical protein